MKAAVLREVGTPLSIEQVQIDNPRFHEVLIRTAACGVCRAPRRLACRTLGSVVALPVCLRPSPGCVLVVRPRAPADKVDGR